MVKALGALSLRSLGGYELVGQIGAGGMGQVFLGRTRGGRLVAIKVIHPAFDQDPVFRRRFIREIEAAKKVSGLYTPPVIDADPFGDPAWLATEYLAVPSLAEVVRTCGPLPEASVRALGIGLAEALIALHDVPIIHRDLKPSNVLVAGNGPRVIDFGIAHAVGETRLTTSPIGTIGYMAPEVLLGNPGGPSADVFALGALLAFAATGRCPFEAASPQAMWDLVVVGRPDLSQVPVALLPTVGGCLHGTATDRPNPIEVLAALQVGSAGLASGAWLTDGARRLIAERERDIAELLQAADEPAASSAPPVPVEEPTTDRMDDVPDAMEPSPPAPAPGARRRATRVDRWKAAERDKRKDFENPVVVWITTFLAWAAATLWLDDKGLLNASWLPHGLFWYLLLLVVPPSLTIFPLGDLPPMPVRRMRVWLGAGSLVALGPGVVVGPLTGLIVGTAWALLHRGGFWSGFLHGSATYGAGLVIGVQLAAVVAGLVTLVARAVAIALWMIIDVAAFGTVFGLRHGLFWGIVAAICGACFAAGSFEFFMEEMPDD